MALSHLHNPAPRLYLQYLRKMQPPVRMVVLSSPTNRRPRMVSLHAALNGVKAEVPAVLPRPSIEAACRRHGYRWRSGPLNPADTIQCLVRQVIEHNASGTHVVRMAGGGFTDAAWCQAKQRLPLAVLSDLAGQVRDEIRADSSGREASHWK